MNKNFAKLSAGVLGCLLTLQACNGDSDIISDDLDIVSEDTYSSTAITSFNIKANSKVLANLDSVYFTIDLVDAKIFNADSLPYGTDVSKLLINLGSETVSKITIKYTDASTLEEKEITYSSSSTSDSINFTAPVKLTVLSYNEFYERTYDLKVNVHQVEPDSLCWGSLQYAALPAPTTPNAQKTALYNGTVYCLTSSASGYNMATTATPADNSSWKNTTPQFSFTPDISSLASSDDALYMLSTSGDLYSSTDGTTWSSTGVAGWHSIIGGYTTSLLGVKKSGSQYSPAIYPSDSAVESQSLPDGFPVSGQSQLLIYTTEWSSSPQALFVGGRCADGSLSASSWGFDGTSWARFSYLPEKAALEGITLIPYTTFTVNTTNWTTTSYDTLFALGGRSASGEQSHTLYISRDWGLNWHLADDLMTLPDAMPSLAFAQGIVVNSVLGSSASTVAGWKSIATVKPNTLWWEIASPTSNSRATTPITSWDCPYIYLFGGESENGTLYNTVWRGVINRLTFKPLQ